MTERLYRKSFIQRILSERRRQRVEFMLSKVHMFPGMLILDVGCGPDGRSLEVFLPDDVDVVGVDLYGPEDIHVDHRRFSYIKRDASDLSAFPDKRFDLTFCIGMLEHICDKGVLRRIAGEIGRVSKQYVIVVPWKWAWIEPHFKFPFFQLLPYRLQVSLTSVHPRTQYFVIHKKSAFYSGQNSLF
jgi:ubiquinone/menaquinone biosynthesis C-methylase UbiE